MVAKGVLLFLLSGIASAAEGHSCKTIDSSMLLQFDVTTADSTIHSGVPQMLRKSFTKVAKEKANDTLDSMPLREISEVPQCSTLVDDAAACSTWGNNTHEECPSTGGGTNECADACAARSWCTNFFVKHPQSGNACCLVGPELCAANKLDPTYTFYQMDRSCLEAIASAAGDPHLQNILGERFDLVQPGIHTLLNIPQGAVLPEEVLFRVTARAQHFGSSCTETYFQALNLTGHWVVAASRVLTSSKEKSAQAVGGMRFSVSDNEDAGNVNADSEGNSGNRSRNQLNNSYMARWLTFGPVAVKVVRGHLPDGFAYLNVFLKNVKHAGHLVGGLLGQDDHRKEATPRVGCKKLMDLQAIRRGEAYATIKPGSIAKAE